MLPYNNTAYQRIFALQSSRGGNRGAGANEDSIDMFIDLNAFNIAGSQQGFPADFQPDLQKHCPNGNPVLLHQHIFILSLKGPG